MGLLALLKRFLGKLQQFLGQLFGQRQPAPAALPVPTPSEAVDYNRLSQWRYSYLWGFTEGDPMRHSSDKAAFARLIGLATGPKGAVTIGASFHPYQLVNPKGIPVWAQTMVAVITQQIDLKVVATTNTFLHMNPPGPQAFPIVVWPDKRLLTDVTPAFGKYVPFVIPFVDFDDGDVPYWSERLNDGVLTNGDVTAYLESINDALRFLLPAPAFVVGFGVLDENNPEALLESFVQFAQRHFPEAH